MCRNRVSHDELPSFLELSCLKHGLARGVGKSGKRLDVDGAFGAIKVMLFVSVSLNLGKFPKHILDCRLLLCGFSMVHLCHLYSSAGRRIIVSPASLAG